MVVWQADSRRLGSWQCQIKCLVTSSSGEQSLAPAQMREQMMGFSVQHTSAVTYDHAEYQRNKAMGNAWHVPTATWLILLILLILLQTLPSPMQAIHPSPLQRVTQLWLATSAPFGPPTKDKSHVYVPQFCWKQHVCGTQQLDTSRAPKQLDPTLHWCVQRAPCFHPLHQFQQDIVEEIESLINDMTNDTELWLRQTPPHVQLTNALASMTTQVPVLGHLLRLIQYPRAEVLVEELTNGFRLMGGRNQLVHPRRPHGRTPHLVA